MNKLINKYHLILSFAILLAISSCQQPGGNTTGSEFMPDMAHSIAYEANTYTYYSLNTWGSEDEYYKYAQNRLPVNGTVARSSKSSSTLNPSYTYGDSDSERERATADIIENPYKITDAGLSVGKNLYNINCAICHGEKADGNGYLVRDDGGVYPVQPAILTSDEFVSASNGRYYHSIMHGKNLMGAYKDKLSYEERWQVIHYIRSLQSKDRSKVYNQFENTLNDVDIPAGEITQVVEHVEESHDQGHSDDEHHDEESHGHENDHH